LNMMAAGPFANAIPCEPSSPPVLQEKYRAIPVAAVK
jgi:hypothetical protein